MEEAAASLGLTRLWNLTVRLARLNLFGEQDRTATILSSSLFQGRSRLVGQPVGRLVLPYLVAGPVRVTRSHWTEYRLGRNARHVTDVS